MSAKKTDSSLWPVTDWRRLERASDFQPEPLDDLLRIYQAPLRVHLNVSFPNLKQHADEIVAEFAEDKILREGWLKQARQDRGRFRDFLRTSFGNFVKSWWKKNQPLRLTEPVNEDIAETQCQEPWDLALVQEILARTSERLQADCKDPLRPQPRSGQIWEVFRLRILEPVLKDTEPMAYLELVQRYELKSPSEAFNMLLSAKRMFRRHLTAAIEEGERSGSDKLGLQELKVMLAAMGRQKNIKVTQDSSRPRV